MNTPLNKHKILTFFHIVMITVISVDSIRTPPFSAVFGFSLLFYYAIAAIFFFIPSALVSAELGTGWPHTGGLYVWVREAFGQKVALAVIWLNWVYNLAWYPTIMTLIAGVSTYLFNPALAENKLYIISVVLVLFWTATIINTFGLRILQWISTFGVIIGTLLPMLAIIILGSLWLINGNPSEIAFGWGEIVPKTVDLDKLAFFSNVLFGLLGLEVVAAHAGEMKNPQKDYPRALLIAAAIILVSLVLASLAIAIVVPHDHLSFVTGILQAFSAFLAAFHLSWLTPFIAFCIILGGLGSVSSWLVGPTKGIMVAGQDGNLPQIFTKVNKHGVQTGALFLQAIIVSFLCLAFVLMPTVNSSFWLLSIITAQLAMLVYTTLFAAAIKLHHHKKEVRRTFKIPGGAIGIWTVSLSGILITLFALVVGFIPPANIPMHSKLTYELSLIGGMLILILIPFILYKVTKKGKVSPPRYRLRVNNLF